MSNGGVELIDFASNVTINKSVDFDHVQHGTVKHAEVVILAPFLLLAIGALLRQTTKALPVPYTMQLLIIGTLLGIFLRDDKWSGALQQSVEVLGNLDPHLMIHVFLPPLIFESAASLEWHLFTKAKWHIIALAGPGLLLASSLTGGVLYSLLGSSERFQEDLVSAQCSNQWSFPAALLLGVIMSATDPVAVVALLHDLGCKATLSTTIEGESLLNDGTALVMFTILIKLVEGDSSDGAADYLLTFVKMSIGGALFGTIFAVFIVQWLRMIFNDALAEISVTLAGAYLCFFIAEYFLHVSGVIAVVCLGLYFGHNGKTSVSPEVAHFLEEFWQCLGFIGNTLIFVVAGTVIGYKLPSFPASEFTQMLTMYAVCAVIRGFVIGLVYFTFKIFGIELELKDQIVATWGGLRGAVGLSLAMMVFGNAKVCEPLREVVMFHTAGIVVLTVSINSTTMKGLVSFLELDAIAPSKELIYDQAMDSLIKAGKRQETLLRADHLFDSTIWEEARKYYFRVDDNNEKVASAVRHKNASENLDEKEVRRRVLMITKRSYWRQFQDGLLSHHSVSYLIHHTDVALDSESCFLDEWKIYEQLIRLGSTTDKVSEKLVAPVGSSVSEKRRVNLLNFLDSIPVILTILLLVFASCILPFTLDPGSKAFLIIENTTTAIFVAELSTRLYCLQEWRHPWAIDPYIAIDIIAVLLDIVLLSEDFLGQYSDYTKAIRSIRFLRLFRLLRLARLANGLKRAKIAAMHEVEASTLLTESESLYKRYQKKTLYSRLKHGFEIASAFKIAREEVLPIIKRIQTEGNHLQDIQRCIEHDLEKVRTALLDIQRLYSEVGASITTSLAARTVLNKQRRAIFKLYQEGLLDASEFKRSIGLVEYQMKRLTYHPPIIGMPKKLEILKQIPWLECVDSDQLLQIASSFEDAVFKRGDILVRQNEKSDSVHVLARGTVAVSYLKESGETIMVDELGMGSVFGEIAWALNSGVRGATIVATSAGLLFNISGSTLRQLAESNKQLESKLWETCGRRLSENLLAAEGNKMTRRHIRGMVQEFELSYIDPMNKKMQFYNFGKIVLLQGKAIMKLNGKSKLIEAPAVLPNNILNEIGMTFEVDFSTDAKFMCHRFALDGDSFVPFETKCTRASFAELEVKRSSIFSNRQGLDGSAEWSLSTMHLNPTPRNRRHSLQFPGTFPKPVSAIESAQNRRSTINAGQVLQTQKAKRKIFAKTCTEGDIEMDANDTV